MSEISFANFGALARSDTLTDTEVAGRYVVQKSAEKLILADVLSKLAITSEDDVLDIGCGAGLLLTPLAYFARSVTGLDHPDLIDRLRVRFQAPNVTYEAANFFDFVTDRRFNVVIAYGVVNYMRDEGQLQRFVDKAVSLLLPQGRLLIADIPNQDLKRRFLAGNAGQRFQEDWNALMAKAPKTVFDRMPELDPDILTYSDDVVLGMLARVRRAGYHACVLPQPAQLPFGNTREDVLISKP